MKYENIPRVHELQLQYDALKVMGSRLIEMENNRLVHRLMVCTEEDRGLNIMLVPDCEVRFRRLDMLQIVDQRLAAISAELRRLGVSDI